MYSEDSAVVLAPGNTDRVINIMLINKSYMLLSIWSNSPMVSLPRLAWRVDHT